MDYVYVLHRSQGEYSDHTEHPIAAYSTMEQAKLHKKRLEAHIAAIHAEKAAIYDRVEDADDAHRQVLEYVLNALNTMELDPHGDHRDWHPEYFITTVPCVRHLDEFLDHSKDELKVEVNI